MRKDANKGAFPLAIEFFGAGAAMLNAALTGARHFEPKRLG